MKDKLIQYINSTDLLNGNEKKQLLEHISKNQDIDNDIIDEIISIIQDDFKTQNSIKSAYLNSYFELLHRHKANKARSVEQFKTSLNKILNIIEEKQSE